MRVLGSLSLQRLTLHCVYNRVQTTRKKYKAAKLSKQKQQQQSSCNVAVGNPLTKEQIAKLDGVGFDYDLWGHYS